MSSLCSKSSLKFAAFTTPLLEQILLPLGEKSIGLKISHQHSPDGKALSSAFVSIIPVHSIVSMLHSLYFFSPSLTYLLLKYYCPLATSLIPDLTCLLVEVSGSRTFDWSCPVLFLLIAEVFGTSGIPAVRSIRLLCIRQRTLVEPPWTPGGNALFNCTL